MIRKLILQSTSLSNGVLTGLLVGMLPLLGLMGLAAFTGFEFLRSAAWVIGLGVIPIVAVAVYYAFLDNVPQYHRAVLTYFGRRQPGAENERPEGQLFIMDALDAVGKVEYDMRERTLTLPGVHVETRDDTKVEVIMSLQIAPRAGQLYHYGNMDRTTLDLAITNAVHESVRAYAIGRESIEELVDGGFAEAMKRYIPEYVNRRSFGERCSLSIDKDPVTKEFIPKWQVFVDGTTPSQPWGIECRSAEVKDYVLPENITRAAAETREAEARKKTAETLVQTTLESIDKFKDKGLPAVAALSAAQTLITPDRPGIHVHSYAGLEPIAKEFKEGAVAIVSMLTKQQSPQPSAETTATTEGTRDGSPRNTDDK